MSFAAAYDLATADSLRPALGFLFGAALGLVYFGSLRWTVRFFAAGRAVSAVMLQSGRIAILSAGLVALAQIGALALLTGLFGLLLARGAQIHRFGGPV